MLCVPLRRVHAVERAGRLGSRPHPPTRASRSSSGHATWSALSPYRSGSHGSPAGTSGQVRNARIAGHTPIATPIWHGGERVQRSSSLPTSTIGAWSLTRPFTLPEGSRWSVGTRWVHTSLRVQQRSVTVTSRRPVGSVRTSDLGWGRRPKLHGMQVVRGSNPLSSTHTNPLVRMPLPGSMNAAVRSGVICQQVIPSGCPAGRVRPPRRPINSSIHRLGTPPSSSHAAFVCPRSCGLHGSAMPPLRSRVGSSVTLRRRGAAARSWRGHPKQWRPPPGRRGPAGRSDVPHAWHGRPSANASAPDPLLGLQR